MSTLPDDGEWPDLDALWRYASGRAHADDERRLREWLAGRPDASRIAQGLRAVAAQPDALSSRYDADAAVKRLASEIGIDVSSVDRVPVRRPGVRGSRGVSPAARMPVAPWWRRVAAVAAIVLVGVWGANRLTSLGKPPAITLASDASTEPGEVRPLRLPDGTNVVLGPRTTMRFRADAAFGPREVWLEGEAQFAIAPMTGRQFRVYAAHGTADDIGTTFTVRAYAGDSVVRVVVMDGMVQLSARGAPLAQSGAQLIRAGQLGQLSRDGVVRTERADLARSSAWLRDTLTFTDASLRDVAAELERWYGVDVVVDSSVEQRTLTGSFARRSLPEILDAVAAATEVRQSRNDNRITLTAR